MHARAAGLRTTLLLALLIATPAHATDVDGPDCGRTIQDFGDAPEGLPLHFLFGLGHFPTCLAPGAPGTQEFTCPPLSSPPGPTGYMKHVQSGAANYWLGCTQTPGGLAGVDSEADGKVSDGPPFSFCNSQIPVDCVMNEFGTNWGQDECRFDGDAGVASDFFLACNPNSVWFMTANCGEERTAYLNILMDMNFDGDWNDNFPCFDPQSIGCFVPCPPGQPCVQEWAVKNEQIVVPSGCFNLVSPAFRVWSHEGTSWMRVSLTDGPVAEDYPWAGSAQQPGGAYTGGETEDVVVQISVPDAARHGTWGSLKLRYR